MTRFVGLGGDVFVNPDHVTSVGGAAGQTWVSLGAATVTSTLSVGEVVDLLEEALNESGPQ